jgi:deoxyribodipyrimidine photo-lyase
MLDITTFFSKNERVTIYHPGTCNPEGKHILYWMQRAQRGYENAALNAAIDLGNALDLPIIVVFVITDFGAANLRHYTFMLEGIAVVSRDLQARGISFIIRRGKPVEQILHAAKELYAEAIISDECELRTPRAWRDELKKQTTVPFACVDADVVVPSKLFPKEEWAARTLRPKLLRLLPTYLQPVIDLEPKHKLRIPPCDAGDTGNPLSYLTTLKIDRSVGPSDYFHGGQDDGKRRLRLFMEDRLARYSQQRNHPEVEGTSELSAYLHFGQISVQQIAWNINHYIPPSIEGESIHYDEGKAAFLEELIVRRELAINFVLRNVYYDELEGCPQWGKETLRKHALDPRTWNYSLEELEYAQTHDELWNASQREMVESGRMHGYMRMYWAKKILEWVEDPAVAFHYAVYLNDKYEIDGRDANGYTGIAWAIGGKHDRPWGPERPIFGLVRYMSLGGMQRKFDTQAYMKKWDSHLKP